MEVEDFLVLGVMRDSQLTSGHLEPQETLDLSNLVSVLPPARLCSEKSGYHPVPPGRDRSPGAQEAALYCWAEVNIQLPRGLCWPLLSAEGRGALLLPAGLHWHQGGLASWPVGRALTLLPASSTTTPAEGGTLSAQDGGGPGRPHGP